MLALASSGRATHHAQRNQQAISVAEREIERMEAVPYTQLGLAAPLPAYSTAGVYDPDSWVVDGIQPLFELPEAYRDPASAAVRHAEPLIGGEPSSRPRRRPPRGHLAVARPSMRVARPERSTAT